MKNERQLQEYLLKSANKARIYARKTVTPGRRGFPDCLLAYAGRVIFVELKSPTGNGRLSAHQVAEINRLKSKDMDVRVIDTKREADAIIQELLDAGSDCGGPTVIRVQ